MEKAVQTSQRTDQELSSVQFLTITAAFVALTYIFTAFINVKLPIAANGGLEGSVIIDAIRRSGKVGYGFDAYNEAYCDMIPAGIVDPTKVTRCALQNAASIAAMVLTTESLVADKKEPTPPAPPMGDPTGGMGGMY